MWYMMYQSGAGRGTVLAHTLAHSTAIAYNTGTGRVRGRSDEELGRSGSRLCLWLYAADRAVPRASQVRGALRPLRAPFLWRAQREAAAREAAAAAARAARSGPVSRSLASVGDSVSRASSKVLDMT